MLPDPSMIGWAYVTLVLAALAIAAPFAHLLELPVRRGYDPALFVAVTHTLYFYFAVVGGAIEVGAVLAAVIYAALLLRSRTAPAAARRWALVGAACPVLAHALFWILIAPVNLEFATWTPGAVPEDWTRFRDQWEFTHAARAGLFIAGFCALLASALTVPAPVGPTGPDADADPVAAGRHRGETTE
jgi:hypothetical protein